MTSDSLARLPYMYLAGKVHEGNFSKCIARFSVIRHLFQATLE